MNDMPVAYQSRAVTEPQREMARRSRDGGIADTNYGLVSSRLSASRSLLQRHNLYGSPPRPYFSMKKSRQKSLGEDPKTP